MPARKSVRRKHTPPRKTYEIDLTGDLKGFHVTMASMSGRDIIRVRSGGMTEVEGLEYVASHTLAHDFDVADVLDLDYDLILELLRQWTAAIREAALPQASSDS